MRRAVMPAGIYIHIPFCIRKCHYCDFYSIPFDKDLAQKFVEALKKEISQSSASRPWSEITFSTLYVGGGTPTVLTLIQLDEILRKCFNCFTFESNVECTVETNPETVEVEILEKMSSIGVNRLSIGFQSFHDDELRRLGRRHTVKSCMNVYQIARKVGFKNIGIDLIFALPEQTLESWQETLKRTVDLGPEHISTYCLTIEPGTSFAKEITEGTLAQLSDDLEVAMYEGTIDFLESQGYEHYEISNFARPGFRSRHNQLYWDHEPYLGLGPTAHSFYTNRRSERVKNVHEYIHRGEQGRSTISREETLSMKKLMAECIFLSLRKKEGINLNHFQKRFGTDIEEIYGDIITKYLHLLMLERNGPFLRLTRKGLLVANTVCADFV